MKYNYIIFDLDGTLLNTLDDLRDSTNYALRRFGFPERTTDEVRRFVGNGVARLIHLAVPEGTDEKTEADCLAVFKAHYKDNMTNKTAPYPGIIELLKKLRALGVKIAVVSNKLSPPLSGCARTTSADSLTPQSVRRRTDRKSPLPTAFYTRLSCSARILPRQSIPAIPMSMCSRHGTQICRASACRGDSVKEECSKTAARIILPTARRIY